MPIQDARSSGRPWHLWLVGLLSLFWNAFGCFDYVMTQTQNEAYLAPFTPEQRAYFEGFPFIAELFWAMGVWGALAGSIALLLRSRHALWLFAVSLAGLAGSTVWQFLLAEVSPFDIMPKEGLYITIVIWVIALALLFYAKRQIKSGNLR